MKSVPRDTLLYTFHLHYLISKSRTRYAKVVAWAKYFKLVSLNQLAGSMIIEVLKENFHLDFQELKKCDLNQIPFVFGVILSNLFTRSRVPHAIGLCCREISLSI